jgi:hypothetical protein
LDRNRRSNLEMVAALMADLVFNIAKGGASEKVRVDPTKGGILLLRVAESDANLKTRATVAAVLANNTEATFTNYARKTGLTATLTVDNTNNWEQISVPNQTWSSAGGATNNSLVKLVIFYDAGGTDATRVPLTAHDFVVTTDGSDLTAQVAATGVYRAA